MRLDHRKRKMSTFAPVLPVMAASTRNHNHSEGGTSFLGNSVLFM